MKTMKTMIAILMLAFGMMLTPNSTVSQMFPQILK